MPETSEANLERWTMTPDQFRLKAMQEGWDATVVELFLKPPAHTDYVTIGFRNTRVKVRII